MLTLKIKSRDGDTLMTDHGIFHLESRYYAEDCVISDATGEILTIEGSVTDENGELSELDVD